MKKNINFYEVTKVIIIVSFIGFFTFLLDHSNRPDAGLYHLPYISILNEEKILIGSVNLHFRFGHISSLQYFFSIFNNLIFGDNGILIPLTIIFGTVIVYFYKEFLNNKIFIIKLFSLFSLIFILTSMNRYSGFGNDDPAHMFYLIATCYFLKFYLEETNKQINFDILSIYCLYTFSIKQFYALIVFLPLFLIVSNYKKIKIFSKSNIFAAFFLCLWLLKNILATSCILYPINFTCLETLKWSPKNSFSSAERVSISSEAWAKAFPDRLDKSRNYIDHLSDYKWIEGWYKNHFKVVMKKILPLILIIITFYVWFLINKKIKKTKKLNRSIYLILLFNLLFIVIWFFKFPTYRYGAAYIGTFFIVNGLIFLNDENFLNISKKLINSVLIILTIFILTKNSNRIINNYDLKYQDYPWPKKNSFTKYNKKNQNLPVMKNNTTIYYTAYPYTLCMYSKSPCTSFRDLKITREITKFNYKIFSTEN